MPNLLLAEGWLLAERNPLRADALVGLSCFGAFALAVYFLPVIIAAMRGHRNTLAIFMLTLLLGWSFIGWAVALVWAFTREDPTT